ncbi:uncharacterized protein SCHCODRAFT_02753584 [Schizophyllum commune H4-8]|nr:uncharacterized protein SCHCODRAFT_02753584 [Schizophyllum commune H4-8]KAI5885284.1 hypothetical protein SCHCODRAFT_02753584 [Schizophyllum commune H4-8]
MHVVLQTPELLNAIFDYVPRHSLPSLIRTCKTFFEPAARRIWKKSNTLIHLARCLPESCLDCGDYKPGDEMLNVEIKFTRPITAADAQRVRIYAEFVVYFDFFDTIIGLSPANIAQLAAAVGGDVLLPNLRHLVYSGPSPLSAVLPLLFSSVICEVTMTLGEQVPNIADAAAAEISAMNHLKARGPASITTLYLEAGEGYPLARLLAGWDSLQDLDVSGDIDDAVLFAVAKLPALHTLGLRCRRPLPVSVPTHWRAQETMRSLSLFGVQIASAVDYVGCFRSSPLEKIAISYIPYGSQNALSDICHAISQSGWLQSLQCIHLSTDLYTESDPPAPENGPAYEMRDIEPLLAFHGLTALSIRPIRVLALRDEDVLSIAQACPNLESLFLGCTKWHAPTLTALSLVHLARYTPRLRDLNLTFDATDVKGMEPPPPQLMLLTMYVIASPIESEYAVASFLSRLFPGLESIRVYRPPQREQNQGEVQRRKLWKRVEEALSYFAEARRTGFYGGGAKV